MNVTPQETIYFNTGTELFVKIQSLLIIPFGEDYIRYGKTPVEFDTCSHRGTFLKINQPCAVIDLNLRQPLRLKHLPQLFPEKVLPISDERFIPKSHANSRRRVAKQYYDYLINFYIDHTGKYTEAEEDFLRCYFQICFDQLKDLRTAYFSKENLMRIVLNRFPDFEEYGIKERDYLIQDEYHYLCELSDYPHNDGRVLFEALLPLHSARLMVPTSDSGSLIKEYKAPTNINSFDLNCNGYTERENFLPEWELISSQTGLKKQSNKNFVRQFEHDFLVWDGNEMICYEIEGDGKYLQEYMEKHENIQNAGMKIFHVFNSDVDRLKNHFVPESSPSLLDERSEILNNSFFPKSVTHFWESVDSEDPARKLLPMGYFDGFIESLQGRPPTHTSAVHMPWHLEFRDGYVYLDE